MKPTIEGPRRLNILYSHRTRGRDVEGVHIKGMTDAFVQLGHNVMFVAVPGAQIDFSAKNDKKNGKYISYWKMISKYCPQLLFELMEISYNLLLYFKLYRVYYESKERHIDFIYERYALNTFATVLFGKYHNIPVILEVNDATGIQRVRRHKAELIARRIEDWVFNKCNAIVTISSEFQRILRQRIVKKEKVTFVSNAVDPNVFNLDLYDDRVKARLGREKIVIGFIGSFAVWHGVDLLLEVMPDVIRAVPNVHFLLVGSGNRFHDIKNSVANKGLRRYVTFTGKVRFEKVPLYLKAMDIGVIPNSNVYGSPVKLFEYMAMEAVPVAPDLPPISDVIEDGITGLIFRWNDVGNLKDRLIYVCKNNEVRKQIARKARMQVLEKHLWSHNAAHVIDVYYQKFSEF